MDDKFRNLCASYGMKHTLRMHSLSDYGYWQVFGEDPNADIGGYHHEPNLGVYEGTLEDVMRYAMTLRNFYSWGAGGSVKPYKVSGFKKITKDTLRNDADLKKKREELQKQIDIIDKELKS